MEKILILIFSHYGVFALGVLVGFYRCTLQENKKESEKKYGN